MNMHNSDAKNEIHIKGIYLLAVTLCVVFFFLFGCRRKKEDTEPTMDQAKLTIPTLKDKDASVPTTDIQKLTDQSVLAKLALEDENVKIRESAVKKLTDQTVLAKVALEDKDWIVRTIAVETLTDQTTLAKVAIEGKDRKVREYAFQKLTDQDALAKVAVDSKDSYMRKDAFQKLTDQDALAKIAVDSKDPYMRKDAFQKITDDTALAKVAVGLEHTDRWASIDALTKITDQSVLAKLALEDESVAAVKKLTDQTMLAKIAIEDKHVDVREAAVERLADQILLAKIAFEDTDERVQIAAAETLTDQILLAKIAFEHTDERVRIAAVETLKDQTLLAKIAIEGNVKTVRSEAFAVLYKIRKRDLLTKQETIIEDPEISRNVELIQKILSVCEALPNAHRARLAISVLDIFLALSKPEVSSEVGDLVSIAIIWKQIEKPYKYKDKPEDDWKLLYLMGERVTIFVTCSKRNSVFWHSWDSSFPKSIEFYSPSEVTDHHWPAYIGVWDLVDRVIDNQVDSTNLISFVDDVKKLTDEAILAKFVTEDKNEDVREAAKQRLDELSKAIRK
jgi:hypothetical protein